MNLHLIHKLKRPKRIRILLLHLQNTTVGVLRYSNEPLLNILGLWSSPSMKGSRPPPCSGFFLTVTGEDQAVMLGGLTSLDESFEAHILHLPTMVSYF